MRLTVPLAGARAGERCSVALVDEPEPPHVGGDLGARGEAELFDGAGAVGLDGALGDVQLLGDLGVGVAEGDQADDLALALASGTPSCADSPPVAIRAPRRGCR